jgi:hypothetical protein
LIYAHGLNRGVSRSISLALVLALVLTVSSTAIVKADDPTWTQTSQADFEAGTLVNQDTTSSPGNVLLALDPSSEQLDQDNPNHTNHWHTIKDNDWQAQTFVAGLTGNLTKVALYLKKEKDPGQLTIEIRDTVGVNYKPGSTILAAMTTSAVVSTTGQEYQFTFPSPAAVTSSSHYAIVLHEPSGVGGGGKYFWAENRSGDIYPNGKVWESKDSGGNWSEGGGGLHDFYFRTYVAAGYYSSGTLTSSTHDTGYTADFGTISWTATTPGSSSLEFQIATNNDNSTWNFKGPDGNSGSYYTTSSTAIWSGHDGDRYIKYKAYFTRGSTPVLSDVSINYTGQAPPPPPTSVGGEIYPINKLSLLAPWIGLILVLSLAIAGGIFRLRRCRVQIDDREL